MFLSDKLAKQIIFSVVEILECHLFITDKDGLVLASNDYVKTGTFILPALHSMEQNKVHTVSMNEQSFYDLKFPCIILPLLTNGDVIGALGIIGDTEKETAIILKIDKLVNLLLEKEILKQEASSKYKLKDQFISLIISGSANQPDIIHLADLLQFDLSLPRMLAIINITSTAHTSRLEGNIKDHTDRVCEAARNLIQNSTFLATTDLIGLWNRRLVILKYIPGKTKQPDEWCSHLIALLTDNIKDAVIQLSLGSFVEDYTIFPVSYRQACYCLKKCGQNNFTSIYNVKTMADYFCENIKNQDDFILLDSLSDKVSSYRLIEKYDIANTVLTLLANNLNLVSASKALFIHRNTLISRLDKLKEVTNLDPYHSFDHAFICKMLFVGNANINSKM